VAGHPGTHRAAEDVEAALGEALRIASEVGNRLRPADSLAAAAVWVGHHDPFPLRAANRGKLEFPWTLGWQPQESGREQEWVSSGV